MSPDLGHELGLTPVIKLSTQAQSKPHLDSGSSIDQATENTPSLPSAPDTGPNSALESQQAWPLSPKGSKPGAGLVQPALFSHCTGA